MKLSQAVVAVGVEVQEEVEVLEVEVLEDVQEEAGDLDLKVQVPVDLPIPNNNGQKVLDM